MNKGRFELNVAVAGLGEWVCIEICPKLTKFNSFSLSVDKQTGSVQRVQMKKALTVLSGRQFWTSRKRTPNRW